MLAHNYELQVFPESKANPEQALRLPKIRGGLTFLIQIKIELL